MLNIRRFGRYEVLDTIGSGAMGIVYRCQDPQIGRIVAVKTMALNQATNTESSEEIKKRMLKEAQAAGILSHPNIVTIFDVGVEVDLVYIVMEYLDGHPMDLDIKGNRPLQFDQVINVSEQLAGALDYAHSKRIIHRDVKPANMMKVSDGRVILMDFGIAWMFDPTLVDKGALIGSPIYMSPEQINGENLTGKADLYSMAVVIFEFLTGARPFYGETFNNIVDAKYENKRLPIAQLNPTLPHTIEHFFNIALDPEPDKRFLDGKTMVAELRGILYNTISGGALSQTHHPFSQSNYVLGQTFAGTRSVKEGDGKTPAPENPHMVQTMNYTGQQVRAFIQNQRQNSPLGAGFQFNNLQSGTPGETNVPKPARVFKGGVVAYDNDQSQPGKQNEMPPAAPAEENEEKKALEEEASKLIQEKRDVLKFRHPEDLTLDGQKKLVAALKVAMGQLEEIPDAPTRLYRCGHLYMRLGKFQEAMAYFKQVLKVDYEFEDAYMAMAFIHSEFNLEDKAKEYWVIAEWLSERKIGRLKAEDYYNLAKKMETMNLIKGAISVWEEGGTMRPWHIDTWRELSRFYLKMKDYENAKRVLKSLVKHSKYDAMAYRNLAVCYQNTREYRKALVTWEKALRLEPNGEGGDKARQQVAVLKKLMR